MNETPELLHVARPMRCNVQQHPAYRAPAPAATQGAMPLKSLALKVLARSRACNDHATKDGQQRADSTLPVTAPHVALASVLAELNGLLARLARAAAAPTFEQAITDEEAVRSLEEALRRIQALTDKVPCSAWAVASTHDDCITCRQCTRRIGALCTIDVTEKRIDQPRRCRSFEPQQAEPDQRNGRDRWPWPTAVE